MNLNPSIKLASPIKRAFAGIIDVFTIAFVGLALFAFAGIPIVNNLFDGKNLVYQSTKIQTESNLFINDQGQILLYPYYDPADGTTELGYVERALYRYYVESLPAIETGAHLADQEAYYDVILQRTIIVNESPVINEACLFDFTPGGIDGLTPWDVPLKTTATATQKYDFYRIAYQAAIDDLETNHAEFQALNDALINRMTLGLFISMALALITFQLVLPTIFKDGATLGKKIIGLGLSNFLGFSVTRSQNFLRSLAVVILHYLLAVIAVPFISFMLLIFGKSHRDLADLTAATLVIDLRDSIVYTSAEEQAEADARLAQIHAANAILRAEYEAEQLGKSKTK